MNELRFFNLSPKDKPSPELLAFPVDFSLEICKADAIPAEEALAKILSVPELAEFSGYEVNFGKSLSEAARGAKIEGDLMQIGQLYWGVKFAILDSMSKPGNRYGNIIIDYGVERLAVDVIRAFYGEGHGATMHVAAKVAQEQIRK